MTGPPDPGPVLRPADTSSSGGRRTSPSGSHGSVTFSGSFTLDEQRFLTGQFSECQFSLIQRSERSPTHALITWAPTAARHLGSRRGPNPLRSVPNGATYVLTCGAPLSLHRIRTRDELAQEFGDIAASISLPGISGTGVAGAAGTAWDAMKDALRGVVPWR